MRILARQQVHQQLVQVIAAEQRLACQQRLPALPLGLDQRLHLTPTCPAEFERLKRLQEPRRTERGRRAPRAMRATRPWSREKTSTIRLVSLYG
jgi:hypothetical protein